MVWDMVVSKVVIMGGVSESCCSGSLMSRPWILGDWFGGVFDMVSSRFWSSVSRFGGGLERISSSVWGSLSVVVSGLLTSTETDFGGGFWDGFGSGGGFSGLFRGFRRCRRLGRGFRFRDYLSPELSLFLCWLIRACFRGL